MFLAMCKAAESQQESVVPLMRAITFTGATTKCQQVKGLSCNNCGLSAPSNIESKSSYEYAVR